MLQRQAAAPRNSRCQEFFALRIAATSEKGTAVLALKAMARRPWKEGEDRKWPKCWYAPIDSAPDALTAIPFTLSRSVTAALSPGHAELLWLACDAAEAYGDIHPKAFEQTSMAGEPIFQASK